jgi:hypothetical protein
MIILHKQKSQDYPYLLLVLVSTATLALYLVSNSQVLNDWYKYNSNGGGGRREMRPEREASASSFLPSFQQQQQQQSKHPANTTTSSKKNKKCAVLLFGLPRAFRTIVLPGLVQNVLRPTVAQYNCDVYAHYYQVDHEKPGRFHQGGTIEQDAVLLLRQAVADLATATATAPAVHIISDTEEQFWLQRNATVQKYRTTLDNNINNNTGKYLYFPWKVSNYLYPLSLDNIVKQWHSINAVFEKMEATCPQCYERIAMLRLDVFYATPIDIYQLNNSSSKTTNNKDTWNQYAVLPAFGKHPVNDRMIYGPYSAVKIWATQRFQRIEEHVRTYEPGYGMHSERFLNYTILPAIEQETGVRIHENPDICFMRVRADESIWTWDCNIRGGTTTQGRMGTKRTKKELIESILQRNCTEKTLSTSVKPVICREGGGGVG